MSADQKEPKAQDETQNADALWAEAMEEQARGSGEAAGGTEPETEAAAAAAGVDSTSGEQAHAGQNPGATERAAFDDLQETRTDGPNAPDLDEKSLDSELDVILDIPVAVSMEIGRTHLPIRNLLRLNQGSVVELDRLAGEPLDVLVNGTLIAHGEVVLINDKYGIRLTDVISPQERVRKLK
ncbi:flagellar motor switch protein FliN [Acidihalobacter ferrooxydans]|uniref:Flagellar motor switch protein FliN n=1 Tax=Acidihalobacter ferrooxydans TaxID=1765967 RepID=A0A1P8UGP3_9GAMM|nr:flagellar motor switch protein FliN [Acidihalobacter ferrooxydans]APZ43017.1 flagellar motor switch protein FliN [Acidihalobacter ferrooxydans]